MLAGMRLGDMAAALEGRRLRRAEQRDEDERTARRFQAGNVAISQVLGALGDHAEREAAQKRQAMLDKERQEDRTFNRSRLTSEDRRRETEFRNRQTDRTLANLGPGLDARADDALEPDAVGAWLFDGSFEGDGGVQVVDAKGSALDDMITTLVDVAKMPRAEAESLARGALQGAEGRRAAAASAAEKAKAASEDRDLRRRDVEAGIGLTEERRLTEAAKRRKLARPPTPKKTAADFAPGEVLPPELRAHPKVAEKMVEYDMLQASLDDVLARKEALNVDTGPVQGVIGNVANFLGVEPVAPAALRAMTGEVFSRYVQGISGAAASDAEVQRLMRNMATMRDQDDVFAAKIGVMKRLTELRKQALLRTYQQAGFPLGRWTVEPAGGGDVARPTTQTEPVASGPVRVQASQTLPDGRIRLSLSNGQNVTTTAAQLPAVLGRINGG